MFSNAPETTEGADHDWPGNRFLYRKMRWPVVVYLARAGNDISTVKRFLTSYRRHPAGLDHDFVIILKGFKEKGSISPVLALAREFSPRWLSMADFGFDIRAYYLASLKLQNPFFCFLNSFSEILADDWLAKLMRHAQSSDVGLVGATGSHESMFTNVRVQRKRLRNVSIMHRLWTPFRLLLCRACFPPFPNFHLRTNGFVISRELMLSVWPRTVFTKRGAYLFENGKNSLSRRVLRKGLKILVVDKKGRSYPPGQWAESHTFRRGRQENLLIADNQTRDYAEASSLKREYLEEVAWGYET